MDAEVLPPPLSNACSDGHPVELWVLVNGDVVPCHGTFMQTAPDGRPLLSATLPDTFRGVVRTGAAVRGFFADRDGAIHTFLTSIRDWIPYQDQPAAARVVLEVPTTVAPCQRRRSRRRAAPNYHVELNVTIRGETDSVVGRLVDASSNGIGVRCVRNAQNYFAEGTHLQCEVTLPDRDEPVRFTAIVSRIGQESLHYLYGMRVRQDSHGRRMLGEILEHLL